MQLYLLFTKACQMVVWHIADKTKDVALAGIEPGSLPFRGRVITATHTPGHGAADTAAHY